MNNKDRGYLENDLRRSSIPSIYSQTLRRMAFTTHIFIYFPTTISEPSNSLFLLKDPSKAKFMPCSRVNQVLG